MERELDTWSWEATLLNGESMREEVFGSIGSVPTHLVRKFSLVSRSGRVDIRFPSGIARVEGFGESPPIRPDSVQMAVSNKVPMFFRRKKLDGRTGKTMVLFRAIGFVAYGTDGELLGVRGLRVQDSIMDRAYRTSWDSGTELHVTGQMVILGG
jgi:hypothetical protein